MRRLVLLPSLFLTASSFHSTPPAVILNNGNCRSAPLHMTSAIQNIAVGNHQVRLRHQVFLGDLGSKGDGDLTGLKLWPTASQPMLDKLRAKVLPALHRDVGDRPLRVLELGSGCGLLGISIAALGEEVVLTDAAVGYESEDGRGSNTLQWLQDNVNLNRKIVGDRATVQKLFWGDQSDIDAVGKCGPFDLVVGSELLYSNESSFPALVATMRKFAADGVPVLLGYKTRRLGEAKFFDVVGDHFEVRTERIGKKSEAIQLAECRLMDDIDVRKL